MIELYVFLLLNRDEKANYLWEHGGGIVNCIEDKHAYNLYSLNGYFVEVILVNNKIEDLRPFRKGEHLNKYLDFIKVNTF